MSSPRIDLSMSSPTGTHPNALEIPVDETSDSHNAVSLSLIKYALRPAISHIHRTAEQQESLLTCKIHMLTSRWLCWA